MGEEKEHVCKLSEIRNRVDQSHILYTLHLVIGRSAVLNETDVLGVLPEALAANVEAVLADETPVVGTHTA